MRGNRHIDTDGANIRQYATTSQCSFKPSRTCPRFLIFQWFENDRTIPGSHEDRESEQVSIESVLIHHDNPDNFQKIGLGMLWVYQHVPCLRHKHAWNLYTFRRREHERPSFQNEGSSKRAYQIGGEQMIVQTRAPHHGILHRLSVPTILPRLLAFDHSS